MQTTASTFIDRLKAAMKAAKKTSARAVSLEAGLSHGTVNFMVRNRVTSPDPKSAEALARVLFVSPEWLLYGTGDAGPAQRELRVEHTERYAGRAEAARAMDGLVEPEAISSVGQWDLNATQDPGALWWIERIKEADRQLKLWRKSPAAERAELEKRAADTDALEAEYERRVKASKVAQAPVNDAAPPLPNDGAKRAKKPKQ